MSTYSIYRFTRFAVLLGLAFSVLSVITKEIYSFSVYLIFYGSIIWLLWILCMFFSEERRSFKKMAVLWMIANTSNLLLFVSFAGHVKNWAHSQGVEIVVAISYFPVIFPAAVIVKFLPDKINENLNILFELMIRLFNGGVGDALVIWFSVLIVVIIQSAGIVLLSRFFTHLAGKARWQR